MIWSQAERIEKNEWKPKGRKDILISKDVEEIIFTSQNEELVLGSNEKQSWTERENYEILTAIQKKKKIKNGFVEWKNKKQL